MNTLKTEQNSKEDLALKKQKLKDLWIENSELKGKVEVQNQNEQKIFELLQKNKELEIKINKIKQENKGIQEKTDKLKSKNYIFSKENNL